MMARLRVVLALGLLSVMMFPQGVLALSTPPVVDLWVAPGERESVEIRVENDSPEAHTFHFSLVHVSFDSQGAPILESSAQDVAWLNIEKTHGVFLEPGASGVTTLLADPGTDIAAGSYAFAVITTEVQSGSYVLTPGTATLVFVTVGSAEPEASCVSFSLQEDGTFSQTLRNDGRGILYDEGNVVLRGPFGIPYAKAPSNPSYHRVFAGQTRTWTSDALTVPWWAIGPLTFSLESDSFVSSCPRIPAGFGWIPVAIMIAGGFGVFLVRRRA